MLFLVSSFTPCFFPPFQAWTPRGEWLLGGDDRGSVSVLRGAPAAGGWAALGGSSDGAPCVVQLRFHPGRTSVALATAAGEIFVVELGTARSPRAKPCAASHALLPCAHAPPRAAAARRAKGGPAA